jgi:hypothetical protein
MSQTNSNQPNQPGNSRNLGIIVLAIIAILGLGFAGYTSLNPHQVMVTQQQFVTNTLSSYNTQTVTVVSTVTGFSTVTSTATTGLGNGYNQNCPYYGCSNSPPPYYSYPGYDINGNFNSPCRSTGSNNTVQCSGYIGQNQNGCLVLVIPIRNPYYLESLVFQYYTLHNLPSSYPSTGTWVTVNGQLYQGYNTSSTGAACPGNYINVTSISQ